MAASPSRSGTSLEPSGALEPRKAEEPFRSIFERAAVGLAQVSLPEGRWMIVNQKFCEIVGYEEQELIGHRFEEITHPEDQEVSRATADGLKSGKIDAYTFEKRYVRKNGSVVWVQITVSPARYPGQDGPWGIAVIEDITPRKRTEQHIATHRGVAQSLAAASSLDEAALPVLRSICEAVDASIGVLWRSESAKEALRCVACWHPTMPSAKEPCSLDICQPLNGSVATHALRESRPTWADEVEDVETARADGHLANADLSVCVGFPLTWGTETLGLIELFGRGLAPRNDELLQLFRAIGRQIGQFIVRRAAEEAVVEAERRNSATLQASFDAIVTIDSKGKILAFNAAAEHTFGYSSRVALGRDLGTLIVPPNMREQCWGAFERYLATAEAGGVDKRDYFSAIREDGTQFPAEISIAPIRTPGPRLFTAYVRDMTELKQIEDALRETEVRLRTLLNASPEDPVQMKDGEGRWLEANDAALRLFQLDRVDYRGLDDDQLAVHSSFYEKVLRTCRQTDQAAWASGGVLRAEEVVPLPDGSTRIFDVIKIPIFRPDGSRKVLVVLARDVSARKHAEAERLRALENAIRRRDEFLSFASHELRTPCAALLLGIEGLTRLAEKGGLATAPAERVDRMLDISQRQIHELASLVERLLDVSRLHVGAMELSVSTFELGELVRDVVARLRTHAERFGCELHVLSGRPVVGVWDHERLVQVVENLISNGMKFGPGRPIEISVDANDEVAVMTVRDHGIGIEPGKQSVIFERFERPASSKHFPGLGLGLYVVHRIVEAHGGGVRVESAPQEGALFTIELPLHGPQVKKPRPEDGAHESHSRA